MTRPADDETVLLDLHPPARALVLPVLVLLAVVAGAGCPPAGPAPGRTGC